MVVFRSYVSLPEGNPWLSMVIRFSMVVHGYPAYSLGITHDNGCAGKKAKKKQHLYQSWIWLLPFIFRRKNERIDSLATCCPTVLYCPPPVGAFHQCEFKISWVFNSRVHQSNLDKAARTGSWSPGWICHIDTVKSQEPRLFIKSGIIWGVSRSGGVPKCLVYSGAIKMDDD